MAKDFKIKGLIIKEIKQDTQLYKRYQQGKNKLYHVYGNPRVNIIGSRNFIYKIIKPKQRRQANGTIF